MQTRNRIDAYQGVRNTDPGLRGYKGYEDFPGNQDELPDNEAYPYGSYPQYPEDQMETLYIYTEDPEAPRLNKHQVIALAMGFLAMAMILALCLALPSSTQPVYTLQTITVPASFHNVELKASIPIIPTGKLEYPATKATGTLTVYNGSVFAQQLPANFIVTASDGTEFATDYAVSVEAGNPPSYGIATVSAHSLVPGSSGNIQAGAINQTYGNDIFVKNLAAFSGGKDASTQIYATNQDKQNALVTARQKLDISQPIGLLKEPCTETVKQTETNVSVTRACTFVTYQAPNVQVIAVRVQGDKVILKIRIVARVVTTHFVK